jgi:hypothetical protein
LLVRSGSPLVFAVMHVFTAGIAGVLNAFLLGTLLTWLWFRFDNLVGDWVSTPSIIFSNCWSGFRLYHHSMRGELVDAIWSPRGCK